MGTTNSPAVFIKRINARADAVARVPSAGVNAGALLVTESVRASLGSIAPGLKLSGVRGSGKIGARFIAGNTGEGRATALVVATGPVQLIERDTKAHDVFARAGGTTVLGLDGTLDSRRRGVQRGGKKALYGKGFEHPVMGRVHTSGTRGQHPFEKGVEAAKPLVARAMSVALHRAIITGGAA